VGLGKSGNDAVVDTFRTGGQALPSEGSPQIMPLSPLRTLCCEDCEKQSEGGCDWLIAALPLYTVTGTLSLHVCTGTIRLEQLPSAPGPVQVSSRVSYRP